MKQGSVALILALLLGLTVQGAWAAGIEMDGDAGVTGSVTANSFFGSGAGLTNINPANIAAGTANINISGTANSVAPGAVSAAGLAPGAVTPAKIAYYSNVAVVATSGGDYTNPATAMADYATWCGAPSASNPCLLRIMPGVYDIGSSSVVMQGHIDIQGSGEDVTTIKGNIDSNASGVVQGASYAEIRFLTVENSNSGGSAIAIYDNAANVKITHVLAAAIGGNYSYGVYNNYFSYPVMTNMTASAEGLTYSYGVYNSDSYPTMTGVTALVQGGTDGYGMMNNSSSPVMANVTISALYAGTNYGIYDNASSPVMTGVTVTASAGTYNYGIVNAASGTVKINHSVITGSSTTIFNESGVATYVGDTQLDGGTASNGGTLTCVGAYDGNYAALGVHCQ